MDYIEYIWQEWIKKVKKVVLKVGEPDASPWFRAMLVVRHINEILQDILYSKIYPDLKAAYYADTRIHLADILIQLTILSYIRGLDPITLKSDISPRKCLNIYINEYDKKIIILMLMSMHASKMMQMYSYMVRFPKHRDEFGAKGDKEWLCVFDLYKRLTNSLNIKINDDFLDFAIIRYAERAKDHSQYNWVKI